jgi:hypothetical protein
VCVFFFTVSETKFRIKKNRKRDNLVYFNLYIFEKQTGRQKYSELSVSHRCVLIRCVVVITGQFSSNYKITIGADFSIKSLQWDDQTKINLQLWWAWSIIV